ncbi:NAD(P)/FAD-dependent oxidoreductase [Marinobacterium lutimaris]|uniref:Glycine/D-amino acid oxidase n=1 Tax=Marinobacterium lutimaris TaxID=568106 RepID=A0A1H6DNU5_9GAMM|nr:FAD-binding oxidoreductase [Marinobacterium lutimaris]SEG87007.1 Glycine/D-amino acid oxidase [Marinobacterium lutimaris]
MNALTSAPVNSLWQATTAFPDGFPVFEGDSEGKATADVVIIGGGFTGLSAAHHLASAGMQPILLEANPIGWGGSGRNGGVVTAKYRMSFPEMTKAFDLDTAKRMHQLAHAAVDKVEEMVNAYQISDAKFQRSGNLKCAHNAHSLQHAIEEAEWIKRELKDDTLNILSREQVAEETGTESFVGGILGLNVGTVHPLNYVRGLAQGINDRFGQVVHQCSPVASIQYENEGVRVTTASGASVLAKQIILATNAYSDLFPSTEYIRKRTIPFRSSMIATEVLNDELQARLLSNERSYVETRRMMRWFRKAEGRFMFGGRGAFGKEDSQAAFDGLYKAMTEIFPALEGIKVDYQWSGHVAMTLDALPHVGRLDERTCVAAGFNGAGVAQSTLLGSLAGQFALGETPNVALLDAQRFKAVPFYAFREIGIRTVAGWYQFLDAIGR